MGETVEGLPVLERLLLHLHHVDPAGRGSSPEHQTQVGISTAIGIQRKHVPRALRRLVEEGWIALELKRVDGHRQRLRVYVLSATGQEEIQRLRGALQNTTTNTMNGPEKVLDLIDAGRISDLHTSRCSRTSSGRERSERVSTQTRSAFARLFAGGPPSHHRTKPGHHLAGHGNARRLRSRVSVVPGNGPHGRRDHGRRRGLAHHLTHRTRTVWRILERPRGNGPPRHDEMM